jgi:hemoglobin
MTDSSDTKWNVIDELGGTAAARALMTDFYDRLFDDIIIGFLFARSDKPALVESQLKWVSSKLGDRSGDYDGPSIRKSHADLPITTGMFDRRHQILRETLRDHDVAEHVASAWLELDESLRDNVVRWGKDVRDA